MTAMHTMLNAECGSFYLAPETAACICRQAGGVEGIVNGMDTTDWSPNVDKFLDVKYDADTVDEGKALAKETLQAELGLPVSSSNHTSMVHFKVYHTWSSVSYPT